MPAKSIIDELIDARLAGDKKREKELIKGAMLDYAESQRKKSRREDR